MTAFARREIKGLDDTCVERHEWLSGCDKCWEHAFREGDDGAERGDVCVVGEFVAVEIGG